MDISIVNNLNEIKKGNSDNLPSVLITGDFCPDRRISELIERKKYDEIFNNFLPFSSFFDISITNLECPLTIRGKKINKVGPSLKGPPEASEALKFAGFNLVSLANNHLMDYGEVGLKDTINALETKGIQYVGAGDSLRAANTPQVISIRGLRIGFLNIAEHEFSIATEYMGGASSLSVVNNYYQILEVKKSVDFLILIIHGGHEFFPHPSPRMKKLYPFFIDLGVDAVIGHHAHVFSGYEVYKNAPIFYNIGNFVFDRSNENMFWHKGFAVGLTIKKDGIKNIYLIPYSQCEKQVGVRVLDDIELNDFVEVINNYNSIISNDKMIKEEFNNFLKKKKAHYLSMLLGLGKTKRRLLKRNLLPKIFLNDKRMLRNLHLIRCQAHREAIIEILEGEIHSK